MKLTLFVFLSFWHMHHGNVTPSSLLIMVRDFPEQFTSVNNEFIVNGFVPARRSQQQLSGKQPQGDEPKRIVQARDG